MKSGDSRPRPRGRRNRRIALLVLALIVSLIGLNQLTPPEQSVPESTEAALTPAATPSSTPTATAAGTNTGNASESRTSPTGIDAGSSCDIKEAKYLGAGGYPDWSPSGDLLVYHQWDADRVYQLHTMKPDGSGGICLTCTPHTGAPRVDRHKLIPVWHPSGRFIAVQGEMDSHPLKTLSTNKLLSELLINGLWTNIYATTPDGAQWYRLTDFSATKADGAMHVQFSPDGSQMIWSRLIEPASASAPWGKWKMFIADFVVNAGVPSLQNIRDITPANAVFVESHGFSPDGRNILFTGDLENTHDWGHDIWTMELASGKLVNLTKSGYWDEHAQYSPSGKQIVYMSSEPYPSGFFKTELMLVNADGTGKRQLTHFNVPGYPESVDEKSMPTRANWNADGSALAVTQQLADRYPATNMWILYFNGPCGG